MNDAFSKRCSAGIILIVLAGICLALSPLVPGMQGLPRALKPVSVARPAHAAASETPDDPTEDSAPEDSSQLHSSLAKAAIPAGVISPR